VRGVAVLTAAVAAGCGSDQDGGLSARFAERTVYGSGAGSSTETVRGAFDWSATKGWAVRRSRVLESRVVQIGTRCFRRFDDEAWSRADNVDRVCDAAAFGNPANADDLMRSVTTDWKNVGSASIRGVSTTHYRSRLDLGAVKARIEMWVDRDGVVRRQQQRSNEPGGFVSVRDYFDFGVDVRVRAPNVGGGG